MGRDGLGVSRVSAFSTRRETHHQFFCLRKHLQGTEASVVGKPLPSGRAMRSELAAFPNQPKPTHPTVRYFENVNSIFIAW